MSTPVGQSVRQPRQDRHRSSASRTSSDRQPSSASEPAMSSWSRRARPRVECRSSPVARYEGHRSAWSWRDTQLPEPDAPLDALAQVAAVRREREARRRGRAGRGPRPAQVGGERQRPDDDARVEDVARVPDRLPLAERGEQGRAELAGEELAPRAAVAVLAAERPAVRDGEVRGGRQEPLEAILAARPVEAEPGPQVEAALAEVAVDRPLERVVAEQVAELPDVAGEPVHGDGGILEPGPGRRAVGESRRPAGAVLPGAPQGGPLARVVEDERGGRTSAPPDRRLEPRGMVTGGGRRLAAGLDQEPGAARRQPHVVVAAREELVAQALHGERARP